MKKTSKALLLMLCAVLLVAASVLGTMAYLTSSDEVVNTFTVGKVEIKLDEAKVDENGQAITGEGAERVDANDYHLLPGLTYDKDPMVTVLKGSESAYIKMTVTFSKAAELDAIFDPDGADMTSIFNGYNSTNWIYKGNTEDTSADTRTYEFWYKDVVPATKTDLALEPLFTSITVPGTITNAQLATIEGMTITVKAYAIQADGFTPNGNKTAADVAWEAFGA